MSAGFKSHHAPAFLAAATLAKLSTDCVRCEPAGRCRVGTLRAEPRQAGLGCAGFVPGRVAAHFVVICQVLPLVRYKDHIIGGLRVFVPAAPPLA